MDSPLHHTSRIYHSMLECLLQYDAGINAEPGAPGRKCSDPRPEITLFVKNYAIEEWGEI
jgi:hypothetical protein